MVQKYYSSHFPFICHHKHCKCSISTDRTKCTPLFFARNYRFWSYFFGKTTSGLAAAIQNIFSQYGYPNAYILGEEASGAFFAGLTYGEGTLFTKIYGHHKVFWQGPSVGWDFGGQGSRLMILVYDLNNINNLWGRYGGLSGSAYLIAGVGFHVLRRHNVLLIPIRTGIGARLGINVGYLKLTPKPTWNPF